MGPHELLHQSPEKGVLRERDPGAGKEDRRSVPGETLVLNRKEGNSWARRRYSGGRNRPGRMEEEEADYAMQEDNVEDKAARVEVTEE